MPPSSLVLPTVIDKAGVAGGDVLWHDVQVSDVVAGLEWVGLNHKLPAVVTMSLGVKVCAVCHQRTYALPCISISSTSKIEQFGGLLHDFRS